MPDFEHSPDEATQPFPHASRATDGEPLPPFEASSRLFEILDGYAEALRAGRGPSRTKLLERHPELAGELEQYLASIEFLHGGHAGGAPDRLGDFRILREIGRGGMGVVYEAEQISLKRRVALKVLRFGPVADEEAMHRFRREAETVAGLHHTNIVPIFAIGNEGGVHYYAMQLIEGRSLAEVAARRGRESFSPADTEPGQNGIREKDSRPLGPHSAFEIADWGLQAAEALAHAHARGVVHRDVKPSNLILDDDGRIWLTDFGLAKRRQDVTLSIAGALLGTPRYMSPEQVAALDSVVDHRTDIYSLGATLYELATGQPIFSATSPHQVLMQILENEPARPRQISPSVPKDLETIILKCLAKQPGERFASARELADDLRALCEGRPIKAQRAGPVERTVRWAKKHRRSVALAAGSAAVALLLVVGTMLGVAAYRTARMGELLLTTDEPQLLAEVFDHQGAAVRSAFPVPMSEPLKLVEGDYHLRLSRPGELSERWPLDVERGEMNTERVGLSNRWLWPPLELRDAEYPDVDRLSINGRTDFIIVRHKAGEGRRTITVDRVSGESGQSVWPQEFRFERESLPAGGDRDLNEWLRLLQPSGIVGDDSRLVPQAVDVDEDGTEDLIFASRTSPSVMALSGADGSLLWWHRGTPPTAERGSGTLIAHPILQNVDDDGVPDAIALFVESRGQVWLSAVSGKTGAALWNYSLTREVVQVAYDSTSARWQHAMFQPHIAVVEGRPVVVLVSRNILSAVDLRTGEPLWLPHNLGFEPKLPAKVINASHGDDSDLLVVQDSQGQQELASIRLSDRTTRWQRPFKSPPAWSRYPDEGRVGAWLTAHEQPSGEGAMILVPGHEAGGVRGWSVVQCLDARTGNVLWSRRTCQTHSWDENGLERLLVGPDLNGDGHQEIFGAWVDEIGLQAQRMLYVAAISGSDGKLLWHWRQETTRRQTHPDRSGPLALWHPGEDGWPLLLVPVAHGPGDQPATFVFASASGELVHKLPEVARPHVGDLNADGLADLSFELHHSAGRRLVGLRGEQPRTWARLDRWLPAHDFDGDGWTDLYRPRGEEFSVRSGKNGEPIWTAPVEARSAASVGLPPAESGDLNGDGKPDLFIFDRETVADPRGGKTTIETVVALSGRDGGKLWSAGNFGKGDSSASGTIRSVSYRYPALDAWDLTGDGRAEALVVHRGASESAWRLSVLDGTDGKALWHVPVIEGTIGGDPSPLARLVRDLNDDGAADLVLWTPVGAADAHQGPWRLVAFSGRDGSELWKTPLEIETAGALGTPLVRDLDGDSVPEVMAAFHRPYDREQRAYPCELVVLDGRSGEERGSWQWQGNADILSPIAVDFDRTGQHSVCLGINKAGTKEAVVLDDRGELVRSWTLDVQGDLDRGGVWQAADVDVDGREEVIFTSGGELVARGADQVLWRWPLHGDVSHVLDIRADESRTPPVIALWSETHVYGLSGRDGKPIWRCDVPEAPFVGASTLPHVHLLRRGDSSLPGVLFDYDSHASYLWRTVVRAAWPTDPRGVFAPPEPAPRDFQPLAEAALVPSAPLPWVPRGATGGIPWWLVPAFIGGGLGTFVVLAGPLWLVVWIIRRQAWHLGWLPAVYGAACWLAPFHVAVPLAISLAIPVVLLYRALREARYKLWFFAIGYAAVTLVPLSYTPESPLAQMHAWGNWWWLDELLWEPLTLAIVTAPGLLFWWACYRAWRARRWKALAGLAAGTLLISVVVAAFLLWIDPLPRNYSWRGWWSIWFVAVFLMGLGVLLTGVPLMFGYRFAQFRHRRRMRRALHADPEGAIEGQAS